MKRLWIFALVVAFIGIGADVGSATDRTARPSEPWNPFAQPGEQSQTPSSRHRSNRHDGYHHGHGAHGHAKPKQRVVHRPIKPQHPKEDERHHGRCGPEVSAVGTEHFAEDEAKRAAIKAWMAEVRHRFGTQMMDIHNAREPAFHCVVSTPGDRISDKIAQWTRRDLLKECRIVARPCQPEVDHRLPGEVVRNELQKR